MSEPIGYIILAFGLILFFWGLHRLSKQKAWPFHSTNKGVQSKPVMPSVSGRAGQHSSAVQNAPGIHSHNCHTHDQFNLNNTVLMSQLVQESHRHECTGSTGSESVNYQSSMSSDSYCSSSSSSDSSSPSSSFSD